MCKDGFEPVFAAEWPGTDWGCLITTDKDNYTEVSTYDEWWNNEANITQTYNKTSLSCEVIEALRSISQTSFHNGLTVCGRSGGDSFAKVRRPQPNGVCPGGTSPCSLQTSVANTVCYPEYLHSSSCPITEIKVIPNVQTSQFSDDQYTKLSFG